MSNHSGSYMLNEVLQLMLRDNLFDSLSKEKTQQFVIEMVSIAGNYDCNSGEILDELSETFGVCPCCLKATEHFEDGICLQCLRKFSGHGSNVNEVH